MSSRVFRVASGLGLSEVLESSALEVWNLREFRGSGRL